jgi:hypothetical protein
MRTRQWRWCFFGAVGFALLAAGVACGSGQPTSTSAPSAPTGTAIAIAATVSAATPTEQPPASVTSEATRELARLPTPASNAEAMLVGGTLWVDARPATGEVLAFIGGKQCGRGQSGRLPSEPPDPVNTFVIAIASDSAEPGCGVPGAPVTISVDGREMNDRIPWQPGSQQPRGLIAGPAFATYYGTLTAPGELRWPFSVRPYVGGVLCGADLTSGGLAGQAAHFYVVVDSEELRPGCGRDGVDVELRLRIADETEIVIDTAPWKQQFGIQRPTVDLAGLIPASALLPTEVATP